MSSPKACGPTTGKASGVNSMGLAGRASTPTGIPQLIVSVVIG